MDVLSEDVESATQRTVRLFCPPSETWQRSICGNFNIPFRKTPQLYKDTLKLALLQNQKPSIIYPIKGDGNCLFRSLAFVLSGDDGNHHFIRHLIVSFLRECEVSRISGLLRSPTTPQQYLKNSGMEKFGTWGTEVELFVASFVFNVRIYVFSKYGNTKKWLEFKPSDINPAISEVPRECIYLNHKGQCHYEVVTEIDVSEENCSDDSCVIIDNSMSSEKVSFLVFSVL